MNIRDLLLEYNNGKKFEYIFFWGEKYNNGYLSNWLPCSFEVEGVKYWCTEQYMMAKKAELFNDKEVQSEIMVSTNQKEIKDLGRKVRNFDGQIWDNNKERIVYGGNLAKFSQDKGLKSLLIATGDKILVEASPYDKIWGIGLKSDTFNVENPNTWLGQNLLGFILMRVREELKTL